MRYLAATDGSTVGDDAVRYAARNALAFDATLVIVHVLTPESELVDGTLVMPGEEAALDDGERVLTGAEAVAERTVAEETGDEGDAIDVETELLTGRPADAITQFATETDADAIFVGHRGLSAEREEVVGSVAKSVVDKARMPVTITR
jgi:nucleotide-binding universal stress UspA family protein